MNYIRDVRNDLAHPQFHNFSGPLKRQLILYVVDLINDVYEDPKLRQERTKIFRALTTKMKAMNTGLKISFADGSSELAFSGGPVFTNNKYSPKQIYFTYRPLFYIPEVLEHGRLYPSDVYLIIGNTFELTEKEIILNTPEHSNVVISKIEADSDRATYSSWINRFENYNALTSEIASMKTETAQLFSQYLREFHFTQDS